jgi:ATP-binding cassette, subfamily B, multidrug efflux pump
MNTFFKLMRSIGKYRILLIFSMLLSIVSVAGQLYLPHLFGEAIDGIIAAGQVDFGIVAHFLKMAFFCILICSLATYFMNLLNNKVTYEIVSDIRKKAFHKMQTLPLSYLDQHSEGDLLSRIITDVDHLSDGLLLGFTQLFTGVITIVITLVFMFHKNIPITIFVVCMTPVSFFVAKFISSHSYRMFNKQAQLRGSEIGLVNEMVGNLKLVKAFGYEDRASQRYADINKDLQETTQNALFYSSLTNPSTRFVNGVIYAIVALIGAFSILNGGLTVGGLSTLLNYSNQYMKPFNDISSVITEFQNALACADRVFELIEKEDEKDPALLSPDEKLPEIASTSSVTADHVFFSYDKTAKLIEDFCMNAGSGKRIAIVGPTGCGKTTLINLLMRFYDADAGDIRIGDRSLYDMPRHELRAHFGMVLQETWLRHDTVRENIRIGMPKASDEEIIEAAKLSHSWEFIRRLPHGLDTVISDSSLSQGEKQLLCITRVMLMQPPMLILDEATSNIDTRTELLVQQAFDKLMEGKTSFIVAHRLSTIRNADLILVMKDGKIIEQGNHEELLAMNGFYKALYSS